MGSKKKSRAVPARSMRQGRGRYSQDNVLRSRVQSEKIENSAPLSRKKGPPLSGGPCSSEEGQLVDRVEHSTVPGTARQRLLEKIG